MQTVGAPMPPWARELVDQSASNWNQLDEYLQNPNNIRALVERVHSRAPCGSTAIS
jgi:hypothetical protein